MGRVRSLSCLARRAALGGLLAGWAVLGGCASVSGGDQEFNLIVKDRTPFGSGPNQIVPDSYLEAGTRVRVIGTSGDYMRVQTVSGETGLVPADSLTRNPDASD